MWSVYLLTLLVFGSGIAFFFYFFLRRSLRTFGIQSEKTCIKVILLCVAVLAAIIGANIFNFSAIIIIHIVVIALLVQLINYLLKKIAGKRFEDGFNHWKKLYGSGAISLVLVLLVVLFGYINLNNVVKTSYTVYTEKNIRSDGYRVALIADVHFGVSLNYDELLDKCAEISDCDIDIAILCGDIVDDSTSFSEMQEVFAALGTIRTKCGIFYTYGNHDRPMSGLESNYSADQLIKTIEKNGITILKDEIYEINDDMVLVGREDRSYSRNSGRSDIQTLLSGVDKEIFILTLDHQPNEYDENGEAGTDLLLSGHTHGGQLWPLNIIQEIFKFNDSVYGHSDIDDDTQAIVTSGFAGWRYPIKTVTPAEYVIIDIKNSN